MAKAFSVFGLFLCVQSVFAAPAYIPIQERAQGQSLVGADTMNDSIHTNPAGSGFSRVYAVGGSFNLPGALEVSIVDTKSSSIGGGVTYYRSKARGSDNVFQGASVSLLGRVDDNLSMGVTGKMFWGATPAGVDANHKDVDVGMLAKFEPVTLGAVARNVGGGLEEAGITSEWAFGGRVHYNQTVFFSAAMVGGWEDAAPYQYGFGFEYMTPYHFSFKAGYRILPSADESYWSGGLSLVAPKILIHYSVELPNQAGQGAEHMLGATLLL